MSRIYDAKKNEPLTIIFTQIDPITSALVTGQAGSITTQLRDDDGAASEAVVVTEQGTSGFYEATFTPTKSVATGKPYLLRITSPAPPTDGAILEYNIRVFPTIAVSGVVGAFLTTLANVKEYDDSLGSGNDAVLTSMIARISALIEQRFDGRIVEATYQEIKDGNNRTVMVPKHRPISTFTTLHISADQTWDATTLVASTDLIVDSITPRVHLKGGRAFTIGFQNVRMVYTAGFATIPLEVEDYAIRKVIEAFKKRRTLGITSISLKDGSITRAANMKALLSDIGNELPKYVRRRPVF